MNQDVRIGVRHSAVPSGLTRCCLPTRGLRPGLSSIGPSAWARVFSGFMRWRTRAYLPGRAHGVHVNQSRPWERLQSVRGVTAELISFAVFVPAFICLHEKEFLHEEEFRESYIR